MHLDGITWKSIMAYSNCSPQADLHCFNVECVLHVISFVNICATFLCLHTLQSPA